MDLVLQTQQQTIDFLQKTGKQYYILQTQEAVKKYNEEIKNGKKVAGLFHSTC